MEKKKRAERVIHTFSPVWNQDSKILMLGTMPSPRSRAEGFYYGHPRNRFWPLLADLLKEPLPRTAEEKKEMALRRYIAVWDVLAGCEICKADDSTIKNPVANDLTEILSGSRIQAVFTTGSKADSLYKKYCYPVTGLSSIRLLSTSPANCRTGYEELKACYSRVLDYL